MLNFSTTTGERRTFEIKYLRPSELPEGVNYFVTLVGDPATNLPDALGDVPSNYHADDLTLITLVKYYRDAKDGLKFANWMYTGVTPDAGTHYDPLYDLGLDNPRLQGKQTFASRYPQEELYVPVLTGVIQNPNGGFTLRGASLVILRLSGDFQINSMQNTLRGIRPRKVVREYVNANGESVSEAVSENTGIGRIIFVRKSKNKNKTEYSFGLDEAPALNIGEWAVRGPEAAKEFIKAEVSRLYFWMTDTVKELAQTNQKQAVRLAVNNVRAHLMGRAGIGLPEIDEIGMDAWLDKVDQLWPEFAQHHFIGADKPVKIGPAEVVLGGISEPQDGDPF